jgi:hypothetical protein
VVLHALNGLAKGFMFLAAGNIVLATGTSCERDSQRAARFR